MTKRPPQLVVAKGHHSLKYEDIEIDLVFTVVCTMSNTTMLLLLLHTSTLFHNTTTTTTTTDITNYLIANNCRDVWPSSSSAIYLINAIAFCPSCIAYFTRVYPGISYNTTSYSSKRTTPPHGIRIQAGFYQIQRVAVLNNPIRGRVI